MSTKTFTVSNSPHSFLVESSSAEFAMQNLGVLFGA